MFLLLVVENLLGNFFTYIANKAVNIVMLKCTLIIILHPLYWFNKIGVKQKAVYGFRYRFQPSSGTFLCMPFIAEGLDLYWQTQNSVNEF